MGMIKLYLAWSWWIGCVKRDETLQVSPKRVSLA